MSECSKLSPTQLKSIYWKTFTNFVCERSHNKQDVNANNDRRGLKYMELTSHSSTDEESSKNSYDIVVEIEEEKETDDTSKSWLPVDYVSVKAELSSFTSAVTDKEEEGENETETSKCFIPQVILTPPLCSPIKGACGGKVLCSPTDYLEDSCCSCEDTNTENIEQEWKSELFHDSEDETVTSAPLQRWMIDNENFTEDDHIAIFERIACSRFIPVLDDIEEDEEEQTSPPETETSNLIRTETLNDLSAPDTDSESEFENEYILEHTPIHVYAENIVQQILNEKFIVDCEPVVDEEQPGNKLSTDCNVAINEPSTSVTAHSSPLSSDCKTENSDYVSSVDSAYSSREGIHNNVEALMSLGVAPAVSSPELTTLHESSTIDYIPVSYATEAAELRKRKKRRATYASDNIVVKPPIVSSPRRKDHPKSGLSFGKIRKRLSWRKADRISSSTPNLSKVSPLSSPSRSGSANTSPERHGPRNRRLRKAVSSIIRRLSSRRRKSHDISKDENRESKCCSDMNQHCSVDMNSVIRPEHNEQQSIPGSSSEPRTASELYDEEKVVEVKSLPSSPLKPTVGAPETLYHADDSDVITEVNLSTSTIII